MTYLETRVYTLKTLSPIHIRTGNTNYGKGFIRLGEDVYVVDAPKLQTEILSFGKLDAVRKYTETFSNPDANTTITDFLEDIGYDYKENIHKITKRVIRLPRGNRFIQSGLGKYFVPGSSIKGAMKTAVLFHLLQRVLKHSPTILDTIVNNKITEYINDPSKNSKQRFAETLIEQAFQSVHPQELFPNKLRKEEPIGAFTDMFRMIKVKDAMIENKSDMQNEDILLTTLNNLNEFDVKTRVRNIECFFGETTIEITIDKEILKSFQRTNIIPPFSDIESLMLLCSNFAQEQWKAEKEFIDGYGKGGSINLDKIKDFYSDSKNKNMATLRVGWGTGMLGTTVSLLLCENTTRVDLRNNVISFDGKYRPRPAPKSRRFVTENWQPELPLGWISLEEN